MKYGIFDEEGGLVMGGFYSSTLALKEMKAKYSMYDDVIVRAQCSAHPNEIFNSCNKCLAYF